MSVYKEKCLFLGDRGIEHHRKCNYQIEYLMLELGLVDELIKVNL